MKEIDVRRLFETALDEAAELEEGLHYFSELLKDNYDLAVFFEDQAVAKKDKKKMFAELFPGALPLLRQVIGLLIDEGLEKSLVKLSEELTKLVSERLGLTFADVRTAYQLTAEERTRIEKFAGPNARLRVKVDPALIGGIRVMTSDGRLLDGSLQGTIDRLKEDVNHG